MSEILKILNDNLREHSNSTLDSVSKGILQEIKDQVLSNLNNFCDAYKELTFIYILKGPHIVFYTYIYGTPARMNTIKTLNPSSTPQKPTKS